MKITDVVSELEASMAESQNARDKRMEELWRELDPKGAGELDLKELKRGLRRIDHPMKNAENMLGDVFKAVDTSGDGKIQYEEFRTFVETAERQLFALFRSIDRDNNGRLDKEELQAAFKKCGLTVSSKRLTGFFNEIDMNRDGYITFEEWRDFLLFMPVHDGDGGAALATALSFYSQIVTINAEGDSLVSEDTLEGLGTTSFLLHALFGSIIRLAQPSPSLSGKTSGPSRKSLQKPDANVASQIPNESGQGNSPVERPMSPNPASKSSQPPALAAATTAPTVALAERGVAATDEPLPRPASRAHSKAALGLATQHTGEGSSSVISPATLEEGEDYALSAPKQVEKKTKPSKLTEYLPEPGYFLAGAIAGGVSRTATAPLDRLKVYLLVNTKARTSAEAAVAAAAKGQPLKAVKNAGHPIAAAITSLYRSGGLRTFFAGNGLNVIKIMPETAIKFGSYEFAKRTLATLEGHSDPTHINPYSKFVAGGVAGMVAQFCVYPLDTLKFRLQCETVQGGPTGNALLVQTAKRMYATGGVAAAYRGVTMGLVGMFPYSAIDMGTFELLKTTYRRYKARTCGIHEDDAEPGNIAMGMMGATSGAIGATIVYPLNVLRTRLQTQGTKMHPPTYTGIWDVTTRTVRNEGVRGLYKGLTPNLLKVAPALSITWIVYENSKKFLNLQ
ncbi:uncharacterized protein PgNI_08170 [Pyricularia grisea]|uniref:Mitochondrial thiamine pyrophosphate carrier 1 n=1 Tax=Pyricularia grisea TaxID=148305 RepID=A0A6P8AU67_PYRGI|nr:uncharacterized protein PgNI_08170 [Pyricularia grisea]TLD05763.1 hypothetical protein PgNI_08170 [Pyricularia grisea]